MLREGECQCMLMLEYHGYLLYIIYIYVSMQGQVCHSCSDFGSGGCRGSPWGRGARGSQAFGGAQPGEHGLCHQARKIRGTLKFWVKRCQTERHCPYENCHFGYIPFSDPNWKTWNSLIQFGRLVLFGFKGKREDWKVSCLKAKGQRKKHMQLMQLMVSVLIAGVSGP